MLSWTFCHTMSKLLNNILTRHFIRFLQNSLRWPLLCASVHCAAALADLAGAANRHHDRPSAVKNTGTQLARHKYFGDFCANHNLGNPCLATFSPPARCVVLLYYLEFPQQGHTIKQQVDKVATLKTYLAEAASWITDAGYPGPHFLTTWTYAPPLSP